MTNSHIASNTGITVAHLQASENWCAGAGVLQLGRIYAAFFA